jgi:hypothetical protein
LWTKAAAGKDEDTSWRAKAKLFLLYRLGNDVPKNAQLAAYWKPEGIATRPIGDSEEYEMVGIMMRWEACSLQQAL